MSILLYAVEWDPFGSNSWRRFWWRPGAWALPPPAQATLVPRSLVPAPGFDQNTCECSKAQTGGAGHSGGGSAGDGTNAGAGGMSGDAGAGEAGAGEAGAAQRDAGGGATCRSPTANTCPDKLTVYPAQKVDLVNKCYMPEQAVSCDGPLAAEVNACWVKLDTGDIDIQSVLPCLPEGWRTCTQMEETPS